MKKLSVIIVTYYSTDLINICLSSVKKYNDINNEYLEIIIVDNTEDKNISNQLFSKIRSFLCYNYVLIKNLKNIGFSRAINIGASMAEGDIICIMNPDVQIIEPIFYDAIKEFERENNLAILGYKQLGGKSLSFYLMPEYNYPILGEIIIWLFNKFDLFISQIFFLSGAMLFFNKKIFLENKGLDENIFLFHEEADISKRLSRLKYKIRYKKGKTYFHLKKERLFNKKLYEYFLKSYFYYLNKYKYNKKLFINFLMYDAKIKKILFFIFLRRQKYMEMEKRIHILKNYKNSYEAMIKKSKI